MGILRDFSASLGWILRHSLPEIIELQSAITAIAWSVWLFGSWNTFESSLSYSGLDQIAPEWLWAVLIGSIGAFQSISLIRYDGKPRQLATLFSGSLWLFFSCSFVLSDSSAATFITFGIMSVSSFWAYIRLGLPEEEVEIREISEDIIDKWTCPGEDE